MAVYYTIAGTKTIQVGDNLNGTHTDITITPIDPDTDVHSGYYLQADNFKVGGGTETNGSGVATSGTNIYEPTDGSWNADTGVTKVTFTNNSVTPGDINNTVNVKVDFGSVTPSATSSINIDIDEKTDNPIELTPSRKVCFQVWLKYDTKVTYEFYQPSINQNEWTVAANPYLGVTRTQTDDGTTDGFIKYKFEGTINTYVENQVYELIRVGVLRANLGSAIDTLPTVSGGAVEPDFSTHDFYITDDYVNFIGTPPQYVSAYNHESFQIANADNQTYIVGATLSYNPLDIDGFSELEDGDFCGLGHRFEIGHRVFEPAEPVDILDEITSVQYPRSLASTPTQETITVRGAVGATYSLNFQKMESTTSTTRSATGGVYSFSGGLRGFKDSITRPKSNEFTIGSSGKKIHNFILPKSTTAERYEVFVTPTGTTKAASSVPTSIGQGTILRDSITTITIQAEGATAANWQLSGSAGESGVTPVSSVSFSRRKQANNYAHDSVSRRAASAVSSSTRLTINRSDNRIQAGMYVIVPMAGAGVPHNTTVSFVRDRTIILSNNCTIAQDALVLFESKSTKIFPFNLTIPAGGSPGSYKNLTATNSDPTTALGGISSGLRAVVDGTTSNNTEVTVVSPGQRKVRVGMVVKSPEIFGSTAVKGVNTSTRVIDMEDPQSLTDGAILTFDLDPDSTTPITTSGVDLIHVHAEISEAGSVTNQEVAQIYGYLSVNNPTESITLPFYLDSILTSGGFS